MARINDEKYIIFQQDINFIRDIYATGSRRLLNQLMDECEPIDPKISAAMLKFGNALYDILVAFNEGLED